MSYYRKKDGELEPINIDTDLLLQKQKHNQLYYYTRFKFFEDSYKNNVLSLGNLKKQNDKDEKITNASGDNTEHFIQCFSLTNEESTSMWGLYGNHEDAICVVFDFDDSEVIGQKEITVQIDSEKNLEQKATLKRQKVLYVESKRYNPNDRSKGSYAPIKLSNNKYYKYLEDTKDKPRNLGNIILSEICERELYEHRGFVKRKGWEHEREYRYLLEVKDLINPTGDVESMRMTVKWEDLGLKLKKIYYRNDSVVDDIKLLSKIEGISIVKSEYSGHFDYNLKICTKDKKTCEDV